MRKVTLIMTTSLDGYVCGPDGMATGNTKEPPQLKHWKLDRIRQAGAHLMGRVTYEQMASFWPSSQDEYAAPMNEIPKVVFSKTLKNADWPTSTIASGDLEDEISALKAQPGGELIVWGGARFAQAMVRSDLIDEYVIIKRPIAYGDGKPLFRDLNQTLELKTLAVTVFDDGKSLNIYSPR
ncbi:MAG: dihydrofolate reductase family protein [Gammaproteobacteria bacterium]